ncbi:MAG: NifB/NifX family molybdenum-iron cluster-binding protein [Candidatus Kariarchaeaceae archaeon]|jgi:predicted Fe-Mo cluster-binding NifX family protein
MAKLFIPMKMSNKSINTDRYNLEDLTIETRFGRTPYYMLIDSESMKYQIIQNSNHHFGGKDKPATIATNYDANAVLAAHMGHGPYLGFRGNGISIYQVDPDISVKSAIKMFNSGNLSEMQLPPRGTCCSGGKH